MDSFFKKKRNVVFIAIFYTFLWGCAFPLVKICLQAFQIADTDNMSKCLVAGIRFFLSGMLALLWCTLAEEEKLRIKHREIKTILIYGILSTSLQYAFTYIALSRIDGSKGAIYDQLCVFIIVLAGGLFFKEDKLTSRKIFGCILGFLGVMTINLDGFSFSFNLGGEGIMLLAVICQTVAYFVAKGTAGSISAPKLVGYGQLTGGILLGIFSVIAGGRIRVLNSTAIFSFLGLAVISAAAYILSLMPLKYSPASEISSFNLLITVFGVVMSAVILSEDVFKWNYLISLLLISLGIIFINSVKGLHVREEEIK